MRLRVLGAGAGGGLPQWNCGCRLCAMARAGRIAPMTQSSLAVTVDGHDWAVLNASPDLRGQLAATPDLHPRALRDSPLRAVVLTNGDIDHIAGLLSLREGAVFDVWATPAVLDVLRGDRVFGVLDPAKVTLRGIALDAPFSPLPGLTVTAFAVPGKVALYLEGDAPDTAAEGEQTVGLWLAANGRTAAYVPGCAALPGALVARLAGADAVLFDGTVWADDDMIRSGTGPKTGARMGHLAMSGPAGSLARLAGLANRRLYIHLNNTNPVLDPAGPEAAQVAAAGWEIARDGQEIVP